MAVAGGYQRDQQNIGGKAVQVLRPQYRACILLVDDNELVAEMGREMLVCLGLEVVAYTCSLKALQAFQEAPQGFTSVLTDLDMPHLTGAALACKMWQIRPDMPIILCTGNPTMTGDQARLLGFGFMLRKPFRLPDIAFAIAQTVPLGTVWMS
jgi:CheY-like chemotaxis protein